MTQDIKEIKAAARKAFAKRDRLEAELRAVNAELNQLKGQYMIQSRTWGIRDERFRHEIQPTKVAA